MPYKNRADTYAASARWRKREEEKIKAGETVCPSLMKREAERAKYVEEHVGKRVYDTPPADNQTLDTSQESHLSPEEAIEKWRQEHSELVHKDKGIRELSKEEKVAAAKKQWDELFKARKCGVIDGIAYEDTPTGRIYTVPAYPNPNLSINNPVDLDCPGWQTIVSTGPCKQPGWLSRLWKNWW